MKILKAALLLLLLAAGIGFALYNTQPVALRYYFDWVSVPLPLFLWAFIFFFVGLVIAGLVASVTKLGLHSRIRQGKRMITELERQRPSLKASR